MKFRIHLINDSFVLDNVESMKLIAVNPDLSGTIEVKCYGNDPVLHRYVVGVDVLAIWSLEVGK